MTVINCTFYIFPGFLPLVYQVIVFNFHGLFWLSSAIELIAEKDIFFLSDFFSCDWINYLKFPSHIKKKNDLMCCCGERFAHTPFPF